VTAVPDWVTGVPSTSGVHTEPSRWTQWNDISDEQLHTMRDRLWESIISSITQALTGLFVPGPLGSALSQLTAWAADLPVIGPLVEALTGIIGGDLSDIADFFGGFLDGITGGSLLEQLVNALTGLPGGLDDITSWVGDIPILGDIVEAITGIIGGGLSDIADWFGGFLDGSNGSLLDQLSEALTSAVGSLDDITVWVQGLISGEWIRQLVTVLTGQPGGLGDIQAWASSLLTNASQIPATLIDGLSDLLGGLIPVSQVGEPVTSSNLLTNPAFSLPVDPQDGFTWEGPACFLFTLNGTDTLFADTYPQTVAPVGRRVDEDYWSAYAIEYPAATVPLQDSIDDGVANLVAAVQALKPGTPFAFSGESQGAVVASLVYENELLDVGGAIHDRLSDFVGGVMFGNPRRKLGEVAPGIADPGGTGFATNDLMVSVPASWYEYVLDGDIAAALSTSLASWGGLVYDFATQDWDGNPWTVVQTVINGFGNPLGSLSKLIRALESLIGFVGKNSSSIPHGNYGITPIDTATGTLTAYDMAVAYLDGLGSTYLPTVYEDHTAGGSGSIGVDADGFAHTWTHPDVIKVAENQTIDASVWVKTDGSYSYTGTPLSLVVQWFLDGSPVSTSTIDTLASATAWTELAGTVAVPESVDSCQVYVQVGSTAISGRVNFDDLSLAKTGKLQQSWVNGLLDWMGDLIQNITGLVGGGLSDVADWFGGFLDGSNGSLLDQLVNAFTGLAGGLDDIVSWVETLPLIGPLVHAITGAVTGTLDTLADWRDDLQARFAGVHPTRIPASVVSDTGTNIVLNATFDTDISVIEEDGWEWDGTQGKLTAGSAKVTADATLKKLESNPSYVVAGDTFDGSVWAKWDSLSYAGSDPIILSVNEYNAAGMVLNTEQLAAVNTPAATDDWTQLTFTEYTVPDGVDHVRLALMLPTTASSGTVWWDEAMLYKTGGLRDSSVPGIGTMLGNVMLGLEDLIGVDINHDGALGTYQTTAAALRANTSAIAYLNGLLTGGIAVFDDFERDDVNTLGDDWVQRYSGSGGGEMETDGHAAGWDQSGWVTRACLAQWNGTNPVLNTDRQKVVGVLGSKGQNFTWWSKCGYNFLMARMSADGTHYIRAAFGADGEVAIGYAAGGSYVQWDTTDVSPVPGNGSIISLEAGVIGDDRYYLAKINDAIILAVDEVGTASSLGSDYRGIGCGMMAEGAILAFQQANPAKFNSWAAWDN